MPHDLNKAWRSFIIECAGEAVRLNTEPDYRPMTADGAREITHSFDAPGNVPGWVEDRLMAIARSMGYHVDYNRLDEYRAIGRTVCFASPTRFMPVSIELDPRLNRVAKVRTLLHELGHAFISEPGRYDFQYRLNRHSTDDPMEEVVVHTAAALVLRLLGDTKERFSAQYIVGRGSPYDLEAVKPRVLQIAATLLMALGEPV